MKGKGNKEMTKAQSIALAAAIALSPLTLLPAAMDHHGAVVSYAVGTEEER